MSWTSRLGSLGRFSPFTRSPPQGSSQVSDADFSYITTEDLKRVQAEKGAQQSPTEELGPPRETDVLVLRHKKQDFPVHFPAYSISRSELSVGQVRQSAAKKLGTDARRVKLLYRGKNLKDDSRTAKMEGLRDSAEILVTVADGLLSSPSDSEDDSEAIEGGVLDGDEESAKRRRNRNKNRKKRSKTSKAPPASDNLNPPPSSTQHSSRAPSPKPPVPTTASEKLSAYRATLLSYDKEVRAYIRSPPLDPAKRDFEHKRLGEMILTQVLLKLDAIETDGDDSLRQRRKDLVRECQAVLNELDDCDKNA